MKKNVLAALLSLLALSVHAQNKPEIYITGNPTANVPRPTPFSYYPNTTPSLFNYSRTYIPQIPVSDSAIAALINYPSTRVSTAYYNGWGQTLETIDRAFVPGKDLVTVSDYRLSPTTVSYLPYPVAGGSRFQSSPYADQYNYYQHKFPDEDDNAYTRSVVTSNNTTGTKVYSFGAGRGMTGAGRGQAISTIFNDASNPIRIFNIDAQSGLPATSDTYKDRELTGVQTEGWHGNQAIEWKNKSGQLICKQVNDGNQYLSTYYVYNSFGLLEYILTPKAVRALYKQGWYVDNSILDGLCYSYKYNRLGQIIKKGTPGRGYELFIYDRKKRLAYSQNALQRAGAKWSFFVYDAAGRIRFSGDRNGNVSDADLQNGLTGVTPLSTSSQDVDYWTRFEYRIGTYPTALTNGDIKQYNYYDDYAFEPGTPLAGRTFNAGFSADYIVDPQIDPVTPVPFANGLLTGTKTRVMNPTTGMNNWLYGVVFYDTKGRVIQTQSMNPWTGANWDVSTTQYQFNGKVCRNILQHYGPNPGLKPVTKLITGYDYNLSGQLTGTGMIADGRRQALNAYKYNDLGQVSEKVLGGGCEIQNIDYNIRGPRLVDFLASIGGVAKEEQQRQ